MKAISQRIRKSHTRIEPLQTPSGMILQQTTETALSVRNVEGFTPTQSNIERSFQFVPSSIILDQSPRVRRMKIAYVTASIIIIENVWCSICMTFYLMLSPFVDLLNFFVTVALGLPILNSLFNPFLYALRDSEVKHMQSNKNNNQNSKSKDKTIT